MSFSSIFGWPLKLFYQLTGSYGIAVILFGILVNLILLPFMAKSKKSMMRVSRLNPKMKALQEKYAKDQQRLQQEQMKLYKEEGVSPMSGCLWTLIPFPILIALYAVIRQPLSKMMNLSAEAVTSLTDWVTKNAGYVASESGRASTYAEIQITDLIHQNWDAVTNALGTFGDKLMDINYRFLGINLGDQPTFQLWKLDWSSVSVWGPALGLFLIPVISAGMSWLSMYISQKTNPQQDAQAANTNRSMMIFMPLISLWICFSMPAAMGVYWIINSVCGIARDVLLTKVYTKKLDLEDALRTEKSEARALIEAEAEHARQREETERRRAAGETENNRNTSKKKIQASQKQQDDERRAEAAREERAQKRARLGIDEPEKPASQVGNRRYARGRAYDPNRFGAEYAPSERAEETETSDVSETGEN